MTRKESFFQFLDPGHLYLAAGFFAVLTAILVALIYIYLYNKKLRFRNIDRITEALNAWIGQLLAEKQLMDVEIPGPVAVALKKESNREFIIDNLIKIRKNLTGAAAKSIVQLYLQLGLEKDSSKRFHNIAWQKKAKGIYELYMMDQETELPDIYRYTNSENEFVRMEAQTALIGFRGFDGLVFLSDLQYPIHDWQQLKLLEQLSTLNPEEMIQLPEWLSSENLYVVVFALKLADIYQQMQVHDLVVHCLGSDNEKVRYHAIKTLGRIVREHTGSILMAHYSSENDDNKLCILQQLRSVGDSSCESFLKEVFLHEEEYLKVEAGRALFAIFGTIEHVQSLAENEILLSISKQVQYEMSK